MIDKIIVWLYFNSIQVAIVLWIVYFTLWVFTKDTKAKGGQ